MRGLFSEALPLSRDPRFYARNPDLSPQPGRGDLRGPLGATRVQETNAKGLAQFFRSPAPWPKPNVLTQTAQQTRGRLLPMTQA